MEATTERTAAATGQETLDIRLFSRNQLAEVAQDIREQTLEQVNSRLSEVQVRSTFYSRFVKRLFDIVLSLIALILTSPVNLFIAVVTLFDVGRPIIFRQTRIGRNCAPFTIYKFRNMTNATDANGELLPPAQRVTKWGKFVRRTSLDELLNFVSILRGDMSIIGPRPLIAAYSERVNEYHRLMYSVKPGLECPVLIDTGSSGWQARFDNYAWYAQNVSFVTDVRMCLRMVTLVFSKDATAKRAAASNGAFLGYDEQGKVIEACAVPRRFVEPFLRRHGYSCPEEAVTSRIK